MKRIFKIVMISLITIILLVVLAASTLVWVVFTPSKLTPIVRDQAKNFISCTTHIDEVELTFFSTFPEFGLKLSGFTLVNPTPGAPSDTLLVSKSAIATIDVKAFLDHNQVVLKEILLEDIKATVFSDANGKTNYDVFISDTTAVPDTSAFKNPFDLIALHKVSVSNATVKYIDLKSKINASLQTLDAALVFEMKKELITASLNAKSPAISLSMDTLTYADKLNVELSVPFSYDMQSQLLNLQPAKASVNNLALNLQGSVQTFPRNSDIALDLRFDTESYAIKQLLQLVPATYLTAIKDITVDGDVATKGAVKGLFNEKSMPTIDLNVDLSKGNMAYKGFPYKLTNIIGNVDVWLNMNKPNDSKVTINTLSAESGRSKVEGKGFVDYILMDDMLFDLDLKMRLNLPELAPMIPADLKLKLAGVANAGVKTRFMLSDAMNVNLERMKFLGKIETKDLDIQYDTISVFSDKATFDLNLQEKNAAFLNASVWSNKLKVLQGKNTAVRMANFKLLAQTSNLTKTTQMQHMQLGFNFDQLAAVMDNMTVQLDKSSAKAAVKVNFSDKQRMPLVNCDFDVSNLAYNADSLSASLAYPKGSFTMQSDKVDPAKIVFDVNYRSSSTRANNGSNGFNAKFMDVLANIVYDKSSSNAILQWQPKGHIIMQDAHANLDKIDANIRIPAIEFDFTPDEYLIKEAKMYIDNSDFELKGKLWNVTNYVSDKGLLMGDFSFQSQTIDVNRLMALTNGLGQEEVTPVVEDKTGEVAMVQDSSKTTAYMVPKGIDITLNVDVKKAILGYENAENALGKLYIKDGTLVLEDMRFITSAAKMLLTAVYKTPRKNHLYVGFDYHMIDIEIESLLRLIPDVDSIMPMLRSFSGKGEFHMAFETYLDSMYNLKKSTLRGEASIKGQDLILMDGETFSEIAKMLLFSKKTKNKIDSLYAEFSIFKNELEVSPFAITMDKYKAIVGGKHNLDMTFDYHISLVKSPIPIKLGVDIKGSLDDYKIRLKKCRYGKSYVPVKRQDLELKERDIRKLILQAVTPKETTQP